MVGPPASAAISSPGGRDERFEAGRLVSIDTSRGLLPTFRQTNNAMTARRRMIEDIGALWW